MPSRSDPEYVRHLEDDLRRARIAVYDLVADDLREVAEQSRQVSTDDELDAWENKLAATVASKAVVLRPTASSMSSSSRAYCPLCRHGSSAPYEQGFALPDGLDRHLRGHGNSHRCSVTEFLWNDALHRIRRNG